MFNKIHGLCLCIVFLFLSFLFILIDIKKETMQIFQKQANERSLSAILEKNKKILIEVRQNQQKAALQLNNSFLETPGILDYLADIFAAQNITLVKIQILKIKVLDGVNVLPVKVTASGQFSAFSQLALTLAEGSRPIVINDFSFQRDEHGAVMAELQLLVLGMNIQAVIVNHLQDGLNDDNQAPVEKMKWGGFLQDQQTHWGFLILPTGKTVEVHTGMTIGVEKGRVIDVKEDEVNINIAGKIMKIASKKMST